MARPTTASRRYAEAAFELASRDGSFAAWRRDLDALVEVLADPRLAVLGSPAVPLVARERAAREAIDRIGGVAPRSRNLVLLLLHRGRLDLLPAIARHFRRLDDDRQGIVAASAVSAAPLGAAEVRALTARLEAMTGGRVTLDLSVDPEIIGGLVVRLGDRLIDGSVRGRLERLRTRLVSGAL